MKTRMFIGAIALLLSIAAKGQTLTAQGKRALDSYLQNAIKTTHIPGMVALVVSKDGIVYEQAFGLKDVAHKQAMTADTIFRLASMTKPLTSLGIMMLVEQGKISLDAPASLYLPALAQAQIYTSFNPANGKFVAGPARYAVALR